MATATKTPKQPQDRKTPKAEVLAEAQLAFSEIEGSELLIPFSRVKGSDQLRLLGRLRSLGLITEDEDGTDGDGVAFDDLDMEVVADFIDYVAERFAVSRDDFEHFTMGRGGFERALNLAVAYAGELGNVDG